MKSAPPIAVRSLASMRITERVITCAACAVLAAVVFADVLMREFTGSDLSWARQIGAYANAVVTLGIIIPPSIPLILRGVMTSTSTSIADLFPAGIGPGLLLIGLFRLTGETTKLPGSLFPVLMMALSLKLFLTRQQVLEVIVGALMDIGLAILILAPIPQPVAQAQGIVPVHFGIMMTVNPETGYPTPPMRLNLIVAMSAFREELWTMCRAVVPFILIMLVALSTVSFVPRLSLFPLN